MIKSWGFEFFPVSPELENNQEGDPKKLIDYFNFYLDLWVNAEAWGYDGVLLSEHHFGGGYSPSPNLLLPLIAQRTKTLRIGVMGMVVPYHNAWRLVEEIGMLDVLCGGRLEVGTSAGIPGEFARIGLTSEEARARYDEALQIIDAGMRNGVVSHQGKYWNFENLPLLPRPVQSPPPMWTTVISLDSARKAARRGSKIATGFVPTDKAKEIFDAYNEEAAKVGNPTGPDQLALRRHVDVDLDEAVAIARGTAFGRGFRNMLETHDKRVIAPGKQALDAPAGTHGYSLGDDEFISGNPQHVSEQIIEQCQACGAGHFQVLFAGHQSLEELAYRWELFGKEVVPALRNA